MFHKDIYIYICSFSIRPFVPDRLGCFRFWANMSDAEGSTVYYLWDILPPAPLDVNSEVVLLGHTVTLFRTLSLFWFGLRWACEGTVSTVSTPQRLEFPACANVPSFSFGLLRNNYTISKVSIVVYIPSGCMLSEFPFLHLPQYLFILSIIMASTTVWWLIVALI